MVLAIYKKYKAVEHKKYVVLEESLRDLDNRVSRAISGFVYEDNTCCTDYDFDETTGIFTLKNEYSTSESLIHKNTYYLVIEKDTGTNSPLRLSRHGEKSKEIFEVFWSPKNTQFGTADIRLTKGLTSRILETNYSQGYYIGEITAENGSYPTDGYRDGFWYVYKGLANKPPLISGSDLDLGGKYKDFSIEYIVTDNDENENVKVKVEVDGVIKQQLTTTTLGVRKYFNVVINDYTLGRHTVVITAVDKNNESSVRNYTFQKINSAPVISGQDEHLGAKNSSFSYTYQVSDNENDSLTVYEKFNGKIINTRTNASKNTDFTITVSQSQLQSVDINSTNTIEVEVTDNKGGVAYRRITFVRNNLAPIISGTDTELSVTKTSVTYSYSVTDIEKDDIFVTVYLDSKEIEKRHKVDDSVEQTVRIQGLDFLKTAYGTHTIKILAEDDKGFSSVRLVTFNRSSDRLIVKLANKGVVTDEMATRVLVETTGVSLAKGATLKVEVCNNSQDAKPTWEDASRMANNRQAYTFQNKTKTANKWGLDIRFTVFKNNAVGVSYVTAIGASFE